MKFLGESNCQGAELSNVEVEDMGIGIRQDPILLPVKLPDHRSGFTLKGAAPP